MRHLDNYDGAEPSRVISETLKRRSGVTPQGFPIYRLVRSESIMERVGGYWHDWDGNLNAQDRGGIKTDAAGKPTGSHHRFDRAVAEIRLVPTYTHLDTQGWVLERWFSAAFFGSPLAWFDHVVMTPDEAGALTVRSKIPRWPDYPSQGKYLMIVGPFDYEPAMGFLEDFIAFRERKMEEFPADIEVHMKQCERRCVERDRKASERGMRENEDRITSGVAALTGTSLEAGRWRSRMFERAGQESHIGN